MRHPIRGGGRGCRGRGDGTGFGGRGQGSGGVSNLKNSEKTMRWPPTVRRRRWDMGFTFLKPTLHEGVFFVNGALVTKNLVPGEALYGEKRVSVQNKDGMEVEYRVWSPLISRLASAIMGGICNTWIVPGAKVLYLGAASGTTVSHVSDIVGHMGVIYAVECSQTSGRELVNMAKKRTNIIPIIEDPRHPEKYRFLVGMVDVILHDVDQPLHDVDQADQADILALNASQFLKSQGHFVFLSKAKSQLLFELEMEKLQQHQFKPLREAVLHLPSLSNCAVGWVHDCVSGVYRAPQD